MTLRKITIDKSVSYVNKVGHSHSKETPSLPKKRDNKPHLRKKNVSDTYL